MRIARPPEGFRITLAPGVAALVAGRSEADPAFVVFWSDITDRLRMTAHREGEADTRLGPGHILWRRLPDAGRPGVRLVYRVLGDEVVIRVAMFD